MQRMKEVFVVGGGPAGLAVAIAARRRGLNAIVADGAEPPIDKACGEGLLPESLAALQDLGIRLSEDFGWRLRGIRFIQTNSQVCADFPHGHAMGFRRTLLHEILVAKAKESGVEFLWNTPVSGIVEDGVTTSHGLIKARWIVGADGSGSRVRRWRGLDEGQVRTLRHATRRHYTVCPWTDFMEVYWGERAQAYVTPISSEEVCIVVMAENSADADFDAALQSWPELRDRLTGAVLASRERGAITLTQHLRRVVDKNIALVGDSSGSVDAITGEGLWLCFRQALALAEALEVGDVGKYETAHRMLALRPARMGKLMLMLGRNRLLRERAISTMASKPDLFAKLLAIHVGESATRQAVSAGVQLGWQFLAT